MKKWQVESELRIKNQELRIQDLIKILLRNRGIKSKEEIDSFLNPKLSKVTPAAVKINAQGLKKALQRIQKAIKN